MLNLEYESGIYMIRNNITGDCYIGQSVNIPNRIREHFRTDRAKPTKVQRQVIRYGKENFSVILLEECRTPEAMDAGEIYWMDKYHPTLNTQSGGRKNKLLHHSDVTRKMLSAKSKRIYDGMSDEEKEAQLRRLTGPPVGHPVSRTTRAKLSAARAKQDLSTPEIMEKKRQTYARKKAEGWVKSSPKNPVMRNPIVCNETGEHFNSAVHASAIMGISAAQINRQLKGRVAKAKGYTFSRIV